MEKVKRAVFMMLPLLLLVLMSPAFGGAESDTASPEAILRGTWQGEISREAKDKFDPRRTFVIEPAWKQDDGKWIADGKWGTTGGTLGRVQITISASPRTRLEFQAPDGARVTLDYLDNTLVGTYARQAGIRRTKLTKE